MIVAATRRRTTTGPKERSLSLGTTWFQPGNRLADAIRFPARAERLKRQAARANLPPECRSKDVQEGSGKAPDPNSSKEFRSTADLRQASIEGRMGCKREKRLSPRSPQDRRHLPGTPDSRTDCHWQNRTERRAEDSDLPDAGAIADKRTHRRQKVLGNHPQGRISLIFSPQHSSLGKQSPMSRRKDAGSEPVPQNTLAPEGQEENRRLELTGFSLP